MIPVSKPDIGDAELEQVRDSFTSGWLGLGPKVETFEDRFKQEFDYEHAIATNSCTSALDLAVKTLLDDRSEATADRGEILVPSVTWISTAFAPLYNNYDVRFVDVDDTLCMAPDSLREKISDSSAAVIPVHYGGQPAKVDEITDIAKGYDAAVIEDCAHAPGAKYDGEYVGKFGDIGCFSFQATKPLTTGEGGMLVTDEDDIAERVRRKHKLGVDKSTHERSEEEGYSWYYEVTDIGYKYFMHDISAGIGLVQLDKLEKMRTRREEIADRYATAFDRSDWIEVLPVREETDVHARYNYTVFVPPEQRDDIISWLQERGIGATVHYMPLYKHPVFQDKDPSLPATERLWEQILTIPMSPTMSEEDIDIVVNSLMAYRDEE